MRELFKKLQRNFKIIAITCVGFSAYGEPCADCNKLHLDLLKEEKIKTSYATLKQKNEDYLKNSNVPAGAVIKVQSNLLLINIKLETSGNKIEAINLEKKKLNNCVTCPVPVPEKS